jgi:uncharacterized PurR-regulated membrane protein YhhQ (DUF165 family)
MLTRFLWPAAYVSLIPLVNWLFTFAPSIPVFPGFAFSPISILVGLVFVVRDFAQRAIGHGIFAAMAAALVATLLLAGPELALASGVAFALAELIDWAVYTFTRRPLWQRIWISSAASVPVDTILFQAIASLAIPGFLTAGNVISWTVGKLIGAAIVAEAVRRRDMALKAEPNADALPAMA